jgi:hypothetical protein
MKRGFANISLLFVLLASVFGMAVASATGNINLPFIMASTDGAEGGGEGGEGSGGHDEPEEPEEPEKPEQPEQPGQPEEPEPDPTLPVDPVVPEPPVLVTCPDGSQVENEGDCPETPASLVPLPGELPICDGSPQRCITEAGFICEIGQGGHECECAEGMIDCPEPPVEPPRKPLPYCDKVPEDYAGACHDRKDFDDITKLYPCNDGTQKEDWRDCEDAYVPPPKPCDPATDPNCEPVVCPANAQVIGGECVPSQCKEGYELVDGKCVKPKPEPPECPPGWEYRENKDDCYKEIIIIINKIIKETNEGKHDDGFPDVDIIGLSVKENGDAMLCAMNIDNGWVQCQEFGMDPQKVNQAFWRVIETNSDKNYDNGNTGSQNVDLAIEDVKNQDFDELDDDRDNHDFGIDLGWVAINPQGDGVTCLTNEGDSLCEPFKVSAQDVDGQITEGVEFN